MGKHSGKPSRVAQNHIFVCRRGACDKYFEHLPSLWDACDAAVRRFVFPPQKYLFPDGAFSGVLVTRPP